jgi:hypothetical protein
VIEISGSRGFFYDDCRSGDRLAREWTQTTPAAWSVVYENNRFWYRTVNHNAAEYNVLMSIPTISNFELTSVVKFDDTGLPGSRSLGFVFNKGRTVTAGPAIMIWIGTGGVFRIYVYYSGGWFLFSSVAFATVSGTLYSVKIRVGGKSVKAKIWIYGTAEPDWTITGYVTFPLSVTPANNGVFSIYAETPAIIKFWSDIRITPIPRTGGVP